MHHVVNGLLKYLEYGHRYFQSFIIWSDEPRKRRFIRLRQKWLSIKHFFYFFAMPLSHFSLALIGSGSLTGIFFLTLLLYAALHHSVQRGISILLFKEYLIFERKAINQKNGVFCLERIGQADDRKVRVVYLAEA